MYELILELIDIAHADLGSVKSSPLTDIIEVSGKQNYEYKSIQKLCEPGKILKSGLYVFSPNKTFPLGPSSCMD